MTNYLGITWNPEPYGFLQECKSEKPWLRDMTFSEYQYPVSVFGTSFRSPYSELLFADNIGFSNPVGLGVWNKPHENEFGESGNLVLLSMLGYRLDHDAFKYNMSALLDSIMCADINSAGEPPAVAGFSLEQCYPNPVSISTDGTASIRFTIAAGGAGQVQLRVYDALGRIVTEPVSGIYSPGTYETTFDASGLTPGMYWYRLNAAGESRSRGMLVVE
jgi:hypothetical protein